MPDAPAQSAYGHALTERVVALAVALACAAVLLIAASLSPAEAGHGTHTQLGLAECGFLTATGLPCATCGMTTSFALAAHGRLLDALAAQPAGAMFAVLTAMALLVCGYAAATGASLAPLGRTLARPRVFLVLAAVFILGWGYTLTLALLQH